MLLLLYKQITKSFEWRVDKKGYQAIVIFAVFILLLWYFSRGNCFSYLLEWRWNE